MQTTTQFMVAHVKTAPKATKRTSPFSDTPCPTGNAPTHLSLLIISPEHIGTHFPGEKIVSSPPLLFPLYDWMISGNPDAFVGTLATSWVFYRDMSMHDESELTHYRLLFFARVSSVGMEPFIIRMTAKWFTAAKEYTFSRTLRASRTRTYDSAHFECTGSP
jgi:hypothetical protein